MRSNVHTYYKSATIGKRFVHENVDTMHMYGPMVINHEFKRVESMKMQNLQNLQKLKHMW